MNCHCNSTRARLKIMGFEIFKIVLVTTAITMSESTVPSIFKICGRNDPDLNECLKDAIQAALVSLKDGLNESGVDFPPIEPHVEKEMKIEYKVNQISGKAILKNVKTFGSSNAKVHEVRANLNDDSMEVEVDMSNREVFAEGNFKGEGRLNALVISTKGYFNNTMTDLTWTWKIYGNTEEIDGETYMVVNKFLMRPEVGDMKMYLPTLFENNPRLNQIAMDFATNYWRPIYYELLPFVEQTWNTIGTKLANRIFKKIPYAELFPQ